MNEADIVNPILYTKKDSIIPDTIDITSTTERSILSIYYMNM